MNSMTGTWGITATSAAFITDGDLCALPILVGCDGSSPVVLEEVFFSSFFLSLCLPFLVLSEETMERHIFGNFTSNSVSGNSYVLLCSTSLKWERVPLFAVLDVSSFAVFDESSSPAETASETLVGAMRNKWNLRNTVFMFLEVTLGSRARNSWPELSSAAQLRSPAPYGFAASYPT